MDLNTVSEVVRPSTRDDVPDWRHSDAWLAGGTWLFSEQQPSVRRLIDLEGLRWPSLQVHEPGLTIAATCKISQLYSLSAPPEWRAAPADPPVLPVAAGIVQDLEHCHRGRQHLHVPAGRRDDLPDCRSRRRLHDLAARRQRAARAGRGFRHRSSPEHSRTGRSASQHRLAGIRPSQANELSPNVPDPHGPVLGATDRHLVPARREYGAHRHRCYRATGSD